MKILIQTLCFAAVGTLCAMPGVQGQTFDFDSFALPVDFSDNGNPRVDRPVRPTGELFEFVSQEDNPFGPGFGGERINQTLSFESNGQTVSFSNSYETAFNSWDGFAISNFTNTETAGFGNQFSSYAGGGADGSENYLVSFGEGATLTASRKILSVDISPTTYVALSLIIGLEETEFSQAVDPLSETDGFFELQINDADSVASESFLFGDYRTGLEIAPRQEFVTVDLSSLDTNTLIFNYNGGQFNQSGLVTPTYFALDNVVLAVPEPTSMCLLSLIAAASAMRRWRKNG